MTKELKDKAMDRYIDGTANFMLPVAIMKEEGEPVIHNRYYDHNKPIQEKIKDIVELTSNTRESISKLHLVPKHHVRKRAAFLQEINTYNEKIRIIARHTGY